MKKILDRLIDDAIYSYRNRKRPSRPVLIAGAAIILVILIIILHACSGGPDDSDLPAGSDTGTAEHSSDGASIHVGGIGYGYLDIPNGWKDFNDSQLTQWGDLYVVQFTDPDSNSVLTLNYTDAPQVDAQTAASSIWTQMEKEGAEAIQGSTVTLDGCDAYQVYGFYKDENIMLVTWSFTDPDGLLHYISAEGPLDMIADVVDAVEKTYVIKE